MSQAPAHGHASGQAPGHSNVDGAVDADPREIARAQDMWHRFARGIKLGIVVIAIGVVLLAWITL